MKQTKIVGLKYGALEFIDRYVEKKPDVICPKCGEVITHIINKRVYENAMSAGMSCDGPKLNEYVLIDGRIVREIISKYRPMKHNQLCLFLDLVDLDGNVLYEWSKEEIDSRI